MFHSLCWLPLLAVLQNPPGTAAPPLMDDDEGQPRVEVSPSPRNVLSPEALAPAENGAEEPDALDLAERANDGTNPRRAEFFRRALRYSINHTTIWWRNGGMQHIRTVEVKDGDDHSFDDDDIVDMTTNPDLQPIFARAAQRQAFERWSCLGMLGASALMVPLLVPVGCVLGGLGGLTSDITGMLTQQRVALPWQTVAGAAGGVVVSGLAGLLLTAVGVGVALFVLPQFNKVLRMIIPDPSDDRYGVFVHQYNTRLARELGVDPDSVSKEYFPLRS